jgi:hypothetical protein
MRASNWVSTTENRGLELIFPPGPSSPLSKFRNLRTCSRGEFGQFHAAAEIIGSERRTLLKCWGYSIASVTGLASPAKFPRPVFL